MATERDLTLPHRVGAHLKQARQQAYTEGYADGYDKAMDDLCSPRRVVSEALLSVVAVLAVILLLASRWGAF